MVINLSGRFYLKEALKRIKKNDYIDVMDKNGKLKKLYKS